MDTGAYLGKEGVDTGAYLGKKGWIQGHILGEITDLEFENHSMGQYWLVLGSTGSV